MKWISKQGPTGTKRTGMVIDNFAFYLNIQITITFLFISEANEVDAQAWKPFIYLVVICKRLYFCYQESSRMN